MKYLLENEQAKKFDEFAINDLGIPSIVLMENAARSCIEIILPKIKQKDRILILCGVGNNGGDGLAIARHLFNYGIKKIDIFMVGDLTKQTKDNSINFNVIKNLGLDKNFLNNDNDIDSIEDRYDVIIDSILGIGAKTNLNGMFAKLLAKINSYSGVKIAIDLPTGVDSNSGYSDENAFVADYTISMFSPKIGLFLNEGRIRSGQVYSAYLGVSDNYLKNYSNNFIIEHYDLKELLPKRRNNTSKFDFGRILIIAGSEKYPGAAALSANACIKAGAGLVELFSNHFHSSLYPEVIQLKGKSNKSGSLSLDNLEFLNIILSKYNVIVIGPGLTDNEETIKLVREILYNSQNKKIIVDADGLKAIIPKMKMPPNILITPHIYEFINTFKLDKNEVLKNPYHFAKIIAKEYNCNILLKGIPTIITNGEKSYLNIAENSGMSSAGMGDVLTGIIAYYSHILDDLLLSGSIAAFIHSKAGDLYVEKYNKESLIASEIINMLKEVDLD